MKLYYAPNACSIGIHVILQEIGKPYELALVDFKQGAQRKPPFIEINPKAKVPALERDDGTILTEFPAIAFYLARKFPEAKLLPNNFEKTAKALELIDYIVATVHMRGFTRIFRPGLFTPSQADEEKVVAAGKDVIKQGLDILKKELGNKQFLLGKKLSIADAALFYIEAWAEKADGIKLPPRLAKHLERMRERPAVQHVLAAEGQPETSPA